MTTSYVVISIMLMQCYLIRSNENRRLRHLDIHHSDIDCTSITTCYECNSPQSKCEWENSKCSAKESYASYWFDGLLQCKDEASLSKSLKYCHIENSMSDKSNSLWLKKTNDAYDLSGGLFCTFQIEIQSRMIQFGVSNITFGAIGLKTIDKKDKVKLYNTIPLGSHKRELTDIKEIIIYYYGNNSTNDAPFQIEIENLNSEWSISPIIICQITLGTLLFVVLMTVLVFLFVSYSKRRKQLGQAQTRGQVVIMPNGLTPNKENTSAQAQPIPLETIVYDAEKIMLYNEKCPICLEKISKKNEVIKLSCNHGFHDHCLREWMEKNTQPNVYCPLCHLKIIPSERVKTEDNFVSLDI